MQKQNKNINCFLTVFVDDYKNKRSTASASSSLYTAGKLELWHNETCNTSHWTQGSFARLSQLQTDSKFKVYNSDSFAAALLKLQQAEVLHLLNKRCKIDTSRK